MQGGDQRLVFLIGSGHYVNVGFEPRARDAARIAIAGAAIEREILRAHLQHKPVVFQANACRKLDGIAKIIVLNLTLAAKLIKTAAVHPGYVRAADAQHHRFGDTWARRSASCIANRMLCVRAP